MTTINPCKDCISYAICKSRVIEYITTREHSKARIMAIIDIVNDCKDLEYYFLSSRNMNTSILIHAELMLQETFDL